MMLERSVDLVAGLMRPLLELLDRTGLFGTLQFTPLYQLIAALSVVVFIGYATSLILPRFEEGVARLRVRAIGRLFAILISGWITVGIVDNASFVLERGGRASDVVRTNFGFILVVGLLVFLEIRLLKMKRRR